MYGEWCKDIDIISLHAIANAMPHNYPHPCPKPLSLFKWLITGTEVQMILDPFLGSGTTIEAAKALTRRSIGIEPEERYCEVAANRCRQEVMELAVA